MLRLTVERERAGYPSQSRFAAKVGVHPTTVSLVESGRLRPTPAMAKRLAEALCYEGDPTELFQEVS